MENVVANNVTHLTHATHDNMDQMVSDYMEAWTFGKTGGTGASARAALLLKQHKEELFSAIESKTVSMLQYLQNKNEQPGSFNEVFHSMLVGEVREFLASRGFSDMETEISIDVMVFANSKHRILDKLVTKTKTKMKRRLVLSIEYLAA